MTRPLISPCRGERSSARARGLTLGKTAGTSRRAVHPAMAVLSEHVSMRALTRRTARLPLPADGSVWEAVHVLWGTGILLQVLGDFALGEGLIDRILFQEREHDLNPMGIVDVITSCVGTSVENLGEKIALLEFGHVKIGE